MSFTLSNVSWWHSCQQLTGPRTIGNEPRPALEGAPRVATTDEIGSGMDIDHYDNGAPAWVELTTPDIADGERFYGRLFGWRFIDGPFGAQSRTGALRGRPVAGLRADSGAQRAAWTTYISVRDAAGTAVQVAAAGGKTLISAASMAGAGTAVVLADHSGARFGVWQPGEFLGAGIVGQPGTSGWSELITDDVDASSAFYASVFGWTLARSEGALGRREWQLNGRPVAGLLPRPPAMPADMPPYWDVYFTVADAAQIAGQVNSLGGTVLMPATAVGDGTIAVFADPSGAVFTVQAPGH
jgi:uncharacterized protein